MLNERNLAFAVRLIAATLLVCSGVRYSASAAEPTLAEMNHTTWTARDGAPQGVNALAQAPDGILWIGSEGGLFTFDGRSFNAFQSPRGQPELPAGRVLSVCAAQDGTIWAGFYVGGIARIAPGHVTIFTEADHQALNGVQDLKQSSDGAIWGLAGQKRIIRLGIDGAWHRDLTPQDTSGARIREIFIDSSRTLWLAQGGRLYRRPLTQSVYQATEISADWIFGFAEEPDHSLWVTDVMTDVDRGRTQHVDRDGKLIARLPDAEEAFSILRAPDGSLIMIAQYHGLRRFAADALRVSAQAASAPVGPKAYTRVDGLSSDDAKTLLLDADGNIWVGGQRGLDRFSKPRLTPFIGKTPAGDWHLCATGTGVIWAASTTNQLYRVSGDVTKSYGGAGDIYSISCGDDGDVWLADHAGIWDMHAGRAVPLPSIPAVGPYGVVQVVASRERTLFVSVDSPEAAKGLWQFKDNRWKKLALEGMPNTVPFVEYTDSRDRLWTGYGDGRVGLPLKGRVWSGREPGLGAVYAILETSHGLLAAGLNGLAVLRENRLDMLAFADRASARGVAGIVEDRKGDLWLNASHGIVHLPATEVQVAVNDPGYAMNSELLTEGEFVGPVKLERNVSTAARDDQGQLWFATLNGVLHFDPERPGSRSHPPILSIRSMSVDGAALDARELVGPRPQTLDIHYLGVNLTAPERVTYRYRLDGLDDSWQDAGQRTEAIYTHLRPGKYTFRVAASNGDGVWTAPVSSMPFSVLPSFYQTPWFWSLCGVAALLIIWLVFMARLRAVTSVVRARAEERADERIRIARELHDTLLQGIQGLLLTFHVAAQKLSAEGDSKVMLEKALATADRIIIEGRNRVNSLRSEHLTDAELLGSLENVGKDLALDAKVHFHVKRSGVNATLKPHIPDEVFYIAREAVTNAFRHADASHITLELTYGDRYFSLLCKDDGRGFDPEGEEKPGHWGVKGMSERAQKLGAELRCRSKPGQGTEILFAIPSYRAYKSHSRLMFYLRAHRLSERSPLSR